MVFAWPIWLRSGFKDVTSAGLVRRAAAGRDFPSPLSAADAVSHIFEAALAGVRPPNVR